jgi:hypothetical protein
MHLKANPSYDAARPLSGPVDLSESDRMDKTKQSGGPQPFKKAPRRKKEPVTRVVLSADAKREYEQLAQERDQRQRSYEGHLPGEKAK